MCVYPILEIIYDDDITCQRAWLWLRHGSYVTFRVHKQWSKILHREISRIYVLFYYVAVVIHKRYIKCKMCSFCLQIGQIGTWFLLLQATLHMHVS